ncbi:MAG: hypothetical protein QNK37_19835 [Acidobacteriota bacterium]|nr:hypothetical protein [Acidobacteriota bacterium]
MRINFFLLLWLTGVYGFGWAEFVEKEWIVGQHSENSRLVGKIHAKVECRVKRDVPLGITAGAGWTVIVPGDTTPYFAESSGHGYDQAIAKASVNYLVLVTYPTWPDGDTKSCQFKYKAVGKAGSLSLSGEGFSISLGEGEILWSGLYVFQVEKPCNMP